MRCAETKIGNGLARGRNSGAGAHEPPHFFPDWGAGFSDVLPHTEEEAITAVQEAHRMGYPVVLMGKGTDLLVADRGVEALVVKAADHWNEIRQTGTYEMVAQCGALLSRGSEFRCRTELERLGICPRHPRHHRGRRYDERRRL